MIATAQRLFFPLFGFLRLRRVFGSQWEQLVERVESLPYGDAEVVAFRLTVDRIRRNAGIDRSDCSDAFCATCISDLLVQADVSEADVLRMYAVNVDEVRMTMSMMRQRNQEVRRQRRVVSTGRLAA